MVSAYLSVFFSCQYSHQLSISTTYKQKTVLIHRFLSERHMLMFKYALLVIIASSAKSLVW